MATTHGHTSLDEIAQNPCKRTIKFPKFG